MLSSKLLIFLAGAFTLTLASPTPGEVNPATREPAPGEPTWYCTYRHRIILDYFTLEGENWNIPEKDLKAVIGEHGGAISNWFFRETRTFDGQQSFIAHVSFSFLNFWAFLFFVLLAKWSFFVFLILPALICHAMQGKPRKKSRKTIADVFLFFPRHSGTSRSACPTTWRRTFRTCSTWTRPTRTASSATRLAEGKSRLLSTEYHSEIW